MTKENINIFLLDDSSTLIIKKSKNSSFFVTTSDSIILQKVNLFSILKFMLYRGFISPKSLEGLLSEFKESV